MGTNLDVAAADQSRPSATRAAKLIHPMRSIFIPHLGKIGLAYFSPSECEVAHTLRGVIPSFAREMRATVSTPTPCIFAAFIIPVPLASVVLMAVSISRPSVFPSLLARKASTDTFLDDAALELGEHAQHLKHRLSGRCSGVEALLMQE